MNLFPLIAWWAECDNQDKILIIFYNENEFLFLIIRHGKVENSIFVWTWRSLLHSVACGHTATNDVTCSADFYNKISLLYQTLNNSKFGLKREQPRATRLNWHRRVRVGIRCNNGSTKVHIRSLAIMTTLSEVCKNEVCKVLISAWWQKEIYISFKKQYFWLEKGYNPYITYKLELHAVIVKGKYLLRSPS